MEWQITLAVAVVAAAGTVFSGWRGSRPPDMKRGPRLTPWRLLMMLSATVTILMLAHLAGLAGAPLSR